MTNADKAWIGTYAGRQFHILNPRPDEICLDDIAHALSQQGRFTGHTRDFYSIAQHSVYVSTLVPPADALWGLLHDASEAYVADLNRPTKYYTAIGPVYKEVETRIMEAICGVFGLSAEEPPSIKLADRKMMWTELLQLFPNGRDASGKWGTPDPADIIIKPMLPRAAEELFRVRFFQLGGKDA